MAKKSFVRAKTAGTCGLSPLHGDLGDGAQIVVVISHIPAQSTLKLPRALILLVFFMSHILDKVPHKEQV